ncbi:MAG: PH domain-containing protein [Candidatus Woesearchaeota archaeon]
MQFKPNKSSYVYYKSGIFFLIAITLSILIDAILFQFDVRFYLTPIFFLISLINLGIRYVKYTKEEYYIEKDCFYVKRGSIFSDSKTKLLIKNITQVKLRLPYIEHKLLKTGQIHIKAAGSSDTEIYFESINDSHKVYKKVLEHLKKNGFTLSKKELIQKEKPNSLAVFFEITKRFMISTFVAVFFAYQLLNDFNAGEYLSAFFTVFVAIAFFGFLIVRSIFEFLDNKIRTYYLYKDTIYYEDGFLTRHYAYIPIENLSDSELKQTFIDRIFGFYNLTISSQGSGNKILFYNIKRGPLFDENLDKLINLEKKKTSKKINNKLDKSNKNISLKNQDSSFFKIDLKRTLASSAVLLISLILILILASFTIFFVLNIGYSIAILLIGIFIFFSVGMQFIKQVIDVFFTKYYIRTNSFESDYKFLTSKNTEFSNEKITSIKILENPLDKFFNTCTLELYSIGSEEKLIFLHVKKSVKVKALDALSFKKEKVKPNIIRPKFDFFSMLKANFFLTIATIILLFISTIVGVFSNIGFIFVSLIILFYVLTYNYKKLFYQEHFLKIYKNYFYSKIGLIFIQESFSFKDNIKQMITSKYPMTDKGTNIFNVAGETSVASNQGNIPVPNKFEIRYNNNALDFHEEIDGSFESLKNEKELMHKKPSLGNDLTITSIISLVLWPLITIIPVVILKLRRTNYYLTTKRLIEIKGIFFKNKKSVLHKKIDHVRNKQGFLNKIWRNSTISIYTTGSSLPELQIRNITNYNKFYKEVEKLYK